MSLGKWMAKYGNKAKEVLGAGADLAMKNPVATSAALGAGAGAAMAPEDEGLEGALEGGLLGGGSAAMAGSPEVAALLKKLGLG